MPVFGASRRRRSTEPGAGYTIIRDAKVALEDGQVKHGDIVIRNREIADVPDRADLRKFPGAQVVQAPPGSLITYGLMERHFHGGWGVDFNLNSVDDLKLLLEKLPEKGITRILPTVMTGTEAELEQALRNVETLREFTRNNPQSVQIEGIHLEGPFISLEKRGSHDASQIRSAIAKRVELMEQLLAIAPDIKLVTMAPEIDPDGSLMTFLKTRGIRISVGHSMVDKEDMAQAIRRGATGVTHTFNAMRSVGHRKGGVMNSANLEGPIPVAANSPKVYPEIIADGYHVHRDAVNWLLSHYGDIRYNRVVAVSDGMALAGLPDGAEAMLGGQIVRNEHGVARNQEKNLAGSTAFLTDCVRNLASWGLGLANAVQLATRNPADSLGMGDRLGRIAKGNLADLVFWDPDTLEVMSTWINGKPVFQRSNQAKVTGH